MKSPNINPKQFYSFIDTSHRKYPITSIKTINMEKWSIIQSSTEKGMTKLIEIIQGATKEEQIILCELIELKEKELGIIYNYLKEI